MLTFDELKNIHNEWYDSELCSRVYEKNFKDQLDIISKYYIPIIEQKLKNRYPEVDFFVSGISMDLLDWSDGAGFDIIVRGLGLFDDNIWRELNDEFHYIEAESPMPEEELEAYLKEISE